MMRPHPFKAATAERRRSHQVLSDRPPPVAALEEAFEDNEKDTEATASCNVSDDGADGLKFPPEMGDPGKKKKTMMSSLKAHVACLLSTRTDSLPLS
jgi:hypothetical protein